MARITGWSNAADNQYFLPGDGALRDINADQPLSSRMSATTSTRWHDPGTPNQGRVRSLATLFESPSTSPTKALNTKVLAERTANSPQHTPMRIGGSVFGKTSDAEGPTSYLQMSRSSSYRTAWSRDSEVHGPDTVTPPTSEDSQMDLAGLQISLEGLCETCTRRGLVSITRKELDTLHQRLDDISKMIEDIREQHELVSRHHPRRHLVLANVGEQTSWMDLGCYLSMIGVGVGIVVTEFILGRWTRR